MAERNETDTRAKLKILYLKDIFVQYTDDEHLNVIKVIGFWTNDLHQLR